MCLPFELDRGTWVWEERRTSHWVVLQMADRRVGRLQSSVSSPQTRHVQVMLMIPMTVNSTYFRYLSLVSLCFVFARAGREQQVAMATSDWIAATQEKASWIRSVHAFSHSVRVFCAWFRSGCVCACACLVTSRLASPHGPLSSLLDWLTGRVQQDV
jgi:hypothetical protein